MEKSSNSLAIKSLNHITNDILNLSDASFCGAINISSFRPPWKRVLIVWLLKVHRLLISIYIYIYIYIKKNE